MQLTTLLEKALPPGSNLIGQVEIAEASLAQMADAPTLAAVSNTLSAILAAVQAQRSASLWTDDGAGFYVRIDKSGAITWTDINGATSTGPGAGARPAAGATTTVDRSPYQAIAAGTGFAIGDLLDHFVITDPATGTVISTFWLNSTQSTKLLSPPATGNITPLAPLPTGASTAAYQAAANVLLSAVLTLLGSTLAVASPQAAVTTPDPVASPIVANGQWQLVWPAAPCKRLVVGLPSDSNASGDWSFDSTLAGTSTSAGIPFAFGAGGVMDFAGGVQPNTGLYVKATAGAPISVQVFN